MIQTRRIVITLAIICFGTAENSWALQSHGAPEGIYVHQMAHLLFVASLAYLYFHTRKSPELVSKGWRYLQHFCILMICWNLLAFGGHLAFEQLQPSDFLDSHTLQERIGPPVTGIKLFYYLTKMDHFLFVPALLAFTIGLNTFYREVRREVSK